MLHNLPQFSFLTCALMLINICLLLTMPMKTKRLTNYNGHTHVYVDAINVDEEHDIPQLTN